jgi:hypothetical protein
MTMTGVLSVDADDGEDGGDDVDVSMPAKI